VLRTRYDVPRVVDHHASFQSGDQRGDTAQRDLRIQERLRTAMARVTDSAQDATSPRRQGSIQHLPLLTAEAATPTLGTFDHGNIHTEWIGMLPWAMMDPAEQPRTIDVLMESALRVSEDAVRKHLWPYKTIPVPPLRLTKVVTISTVGKPPPTPDDYPYLGPFTALLMESPDSVGVGWRSLTPEGLSEVAIVVSGKEGGRPYTVFYGSASGFFCAKPWWEAPTLVAAAFGGLIRLALGENPDPNIVPPPPCDGEEVLLNTWLWTYASSLLGLGDQLANSFGLRFENVFSADPITLKNCAPSERLERRPRASLIDAIAYLSIPGIGGLVGLGDFDLAEPRVHPVPKGWALAAAFASVDLLGWGKQVGIIDDDCMAIIEAERATWER
jgi:hypothetical protein